MINQSEEQMKAEALAVKVTARPALLARRLEFMTPVP
jgi:hypothetical protein